MTCSSLGRPTNRTQLRILACTNSSKSSPFHFGRSIRGSFSLLSPAMPHPSHTRGELQRRELVTQLDLEGTLPNHRRCTTSQLHFRVSAHRGASFLRDLRASGGAHAGRGLPQKRGTAYPGHLQREGRFPPLPAPRESGTVLPDWSGTACELHLVGTAIGAKVLSVEVVVLAAFLAATWTKPWFPVVVCTTPPLPGMEACGAHGLSQTSETQVTTRKDAGSFTARVAAPARISSQQVVSDWARWSSAKRGRRPPGRARRPQFPGDPRDTIWEPPHAKPWQYHEEVTVLLGARVVLVPFVGFPDISVPGVSLVRSPSASGGTVRGQSNRQAITTVRSPRSSPFYRVHSTSSHIGPGTGRKRGFGKSLAAAVENHRATTTTPVLGADTAACPTDEGDATTSSSTPPKPEVAPAVSDGYWYGRHTRC